MRPPAVASTTLHPGPEAVITSSLVQASKNTSAWPGPVDDTGQEVSQNTMPFYQQQEFFAILGGVIGFWGGVFGTGVIFLVLAAIRRYKKAKEAEANQRETKRGEANATTEEQTAMLATPSISRSQHPSPGGPQSFPLQAKVKNPNPAGAKGS